MALQASLSMFASKFERTSNPGRFPWIGGALALLLAPAECSICTLPLVRLRAYPVCDGCLDGLRRSPMAGCTVCGRKLGMESERAAGLSRSDERLCSDCTEERPAYRRASSFGDYGGALRRLVHLHKFEGMRALAGPLGACLAEVMAETRGEVSGPVDVVAVPLFQGKRAFNQSALLADEAVRRLRQLDSGWELRPRHQMLRRIKRTESQSDLTPRQRRLNVRGAFAVRGDVRGLQVLLVDDVYTTGATAKECTRVLLRAGAASVRVVTLAQTQRPMVTMWDPVSFSASAIADAEGQWDDFGSGRERR